MKSSVASAGFRVWARTKAAASASFQSFTAPFVGRYKTSTVPWRRSNSCFQVAKSAAITYVTSSPSARYFGSSSALLLRSERLSSERTPRRRRLGKYLLARSIASRTGTTSTMPVTCAVGRP
jgi:hypothetical protein